MERRLSREFSGMLDPLLRGFWCDGLLPERDIFDGRRPRIMGVAWLGKTGQERWEFTLFLRRDTKNRATIDWAAHFPPWNVTRWVSIDVRRRRVEMESAVAVPDLH